MRLFTKLYADLFDLTADEAVGLFGDVKPIETRSSKSCSIHPHKSCKIKLDRTYGELTVIGFAGQNNWVCVCSHDKIQVVNGGNLRNRKSCGCLPRKTNRTHGMSNSSEYAIWRGMIARCENPKNRAYKNYGGRGITVCLEWHQFSTFFKDMGKRPNKRTLERKNNNLGYCPENCAWASWKKQANNKRKRAFHASHNQRRFIAGHVINRRIIRSNNQSAFARVHNLSSKGISMCLYGELKQYKGWKFKWID